MDGTDARYEWCMNERTEGTLALRRWWRCNGALLRRILGCFWHFIYKHVELIDINWYDGICRKMKHTREGGIYFLAFRLRMHLPDLFYFFPINNIFIDSANFFSLIEKIEWAFLMFLFFAYHSDWSMVYSAYGRCRLSFGNILDAVDRVFYYQLVVKCERVTIPDGLMYWAAPAKTQIHIQ